MKLNFDQIRIVLFVVPIFASFFYLELFIAKKRNLNLYFIKDTLANFSILFIRSTLNAIMTGGAILAILMAVAKYNLHLVDKLSPFWYWFWLLIGQDFLYYWFHRYSHECRWGWASHVVHHSSNYINYVTAVRESVTYLFSGIWIFWLPLIIIGFNPYHVVIATVISLMYQFFLHTRLIDKLGFYEYIFNTPSHHRVHHARNPQYINKNYAGTLIIWDRMFGTFALEEESPDYGLVHQIYNYNPFYILFHGWYEMFQTVIKRRNLKYFFVFPK